MTVRVGVIGTGWWATRAHLPALTASTEAEVVAIADPDAGNRTRAAAHFGVEQTFDDARDMLRAVPLDAAVIAVPHRDHAPLARACLERGLHVLLEKPMTVDPTDAFDLVALARHVERELIVGYPWHYSSQVLAVRSLIASGTIGRVEAVTSLFASIVRELYAGNPEPYRDALGYTFNVPGQSTYSEPSLAGGGQGQTQVTHAAALLQWITGLVPFEVAAFTASHELEVDLVDAASVRFDSGAIGTITSTGSVTARQEEIMEYRFFGTDGHITFDVNGGTATLFAADGSSKRLPDQPLEERYPEWAPAQNLVAVAASGAANGSPPELGARTVALVDAMYRSAQTGRAERVAVAIPDMEARP